MKDLDYNPSNMFKFLMHRASCQTLDYKHEPCSYNAIVRLGYKNGCIDHISFNAHHCSLAYQNADTFWCNATTGVMSNVHYAPVTKTCPWNAACINYRLDSVDNEYHLNKVYVDELCRCILDNCFKLAQQRDIWLFNNLSSKWKFINAGETLEQFIVEMDMQQLVEHPWIKL